MADPCALAASPLAPLYGCALSPGAAAAARQAARASAGAFDGTSEATVNIDRSIHLRHNLFRLSVSPR